MANADEGLLCSCGQEIDYLSAENHLRIFPSPDLLKALWDFIGLMDDVSWHGTFMIDADRLKLIKLEQVQGLGIISLGELRSWRTIAHHHTRHVTGKTRAVALNILGISREKCDINDYHPHKEDCISCLENQMNEQNLKDGKICLPRMLGLPLDQEDKFDGIHHKYEIADIKFEDIVDETGVPVKLGIHLKSRTRPAKKGLGRGIEAIKALYAQLIFSAYQTRMGQIHFDILGASIPNIINPEVVDSMKLAVNLLGFPLMVLDEDDWLKIVDASMERFAFN